MPPLVSSSDIICVSTNVLVFVVVQCLFFYFLASKQFDELVKDKLKMLQPFLRRDRIGKELICRKLSLMTNRVRAWEEIDAPPPHAKTVWVKDRETVKFMEDDTYLQYEDSLGMKRWSKPVFTIDQFKKQNSQKNSDNLKCLLTWSSPFVIVALAVMMTSAAFAVKNRTWKPEHTLGLITVIFCFVTEVIYFFSIFRNYRVLGDWDAIEQTIKHVLPNRNDLSVVERTASDTADRMKAVREDFQPKTMIDEVSVRDRTKAVREDFQPKTMIDGVSVRVNSFSSFFDSDLSTP